MVRTVFLNEILLQLRDKRIVLTVGILCFILLSTTIMGWQQYLNHQASNTNFAQEIRNQWIEQGDKHPHRASHFGIFVSKPISSLSIIEPGLASAVGQAIWLGAHERSTFSNPPKHDDMTASILFGSSSPLLIIQMLGGLLALVLGAFGVVREKESGILRQTLAQGGSLTYWILGKYLALASILLLALLPISLMVSVIILTQETELSTSEMLTRFMWLMIANLLFLFTLLAIGLIISIFSNQSRAAFLSALSLWIILFVIAPRATSSLTEMIAPSTSWSEFQARMNNKFTSGFDEYPGYSEQLQQLEVETLKKYNVTDVTQLPVGYSGIRMLHMDEWSNKVGDHEYEKLKGEWKQQNNIHIVASFVSPSLAVQLFSQGMATSDWSHYQDFAEKAEKYRRNVGKFLNHTIKRELIGDVWEMDSNESVWSKTPKFKYSSPSSQWAFQQQLIPSINLILWFSISLLCLIRMTRRIKP